LLRAKQPRRHFFLHRVDLSAATHSANCREILRRVIRQARPEHPFTIDAWVLLPEHLHCIWTLAEGDADLSKRWGLIKALFTKETNRAPPQSGRSFGE
jgi:REP element-mobilizing transposase RayT